MNFALSTKTASERVTLQRLESADAPSSPAQAQAQEPGVDTTRRPDHESAATAFKAKQLDPRIAALRMRIDQSLDAAPVQAKKPDSLQTEGFSRDEDGFLFFHGTRNDDNYRISETQDGTLVVDNLDSGESFSQKPESGDEYLQVKLHDGNDRLTVDDSVRFVLEIDGGRGDDSIDAGQATWPVEITGGEGNDLLFGGSDHDKIAGGPGRDIIAGGAGDDQLMGDDGNDGLIGGPGEDYLSGGPGQDMLIGGSGSDALYAGRVDHHIEPGQSFETGVGVADGDADTVVMEKGTKPLTEAGAADIFPSFSKANAEAWLADHPEIKIVGSPDFQDARIADIGVLLSTKQGSGLLNDLSAKLKASGTEYEVVESRIGGSASHSAFSSEVTISNRAKLYGDHNLSLHPLPAVHHELVHAYQHHVTKPPVGSTLLKNGTSIRNVELQATGLEWIDEQGKLHPSDELKYTENKFRAELGLKRREAYGRTVSPPVSFKKTFY